MNLIQIYSMMEENKISLEEAATALKMTPKSMKIRVTMWGHRLPLLLATLDKIRSDTITRGEAASTLGIGEREVNRLMVNWHVHKPIKPYLVKRTVSKVKWEVRKKWAIDYIADSCTIEEAAGSASVSSRQMRRWVSDLLSHHYGMVFKDLKGLPNLRRRRLANEIDDAEGFELAKMGVLKAISDGRKNLTEEAIDRLVAKRSKRG